MKTLLVYIESVGDLVSKTSLPVITAALKAKIQFKVDRVIGVLIGGEGTKSAADSIKKYGLSEILVYDRVFLSNYNAVDFCSVSLKVIEEIKPDYFMSLASARGKDFMPRVAGVLDAPQASDVIDFMDTGAYSRPIYAGNVISDILMSGDFHCITVRGSAFDQPTLVDSESEIRELNFSIQKTDQVEVISFDTVKSERPELGEASIIVSGGRALKSAENFEKIMFPLADSLGAAVGASRAAVDSGYAPNDWQVGQTGKIVAPKLYIAVGISGAVQHLAGMKDSKVIVAINKDPEAPIFEVADYGLVADLYEAVPEMVKLIQG